MSKYDYDASKVIAINDYPFAALIMAAIRQADTYNASLLREAFPGIYAELEARYNAPGGVIPSDAAPY